IDFATPATERPSTAGTELLILDPAVGHSDHLMAALRPGVEVVRLDGDGCGLEQIAVAVAGRRGLRALHIVSHGEPGALLLAGERVDLQVLASRHQALTRVAAALGDGAEVLLYGCSVASGPAGRRFLEYLEDVLGTPVAAAEGPIGDPAAGGGWTLSRRDGGAVPFQAFRETVWA